MKTIKDLEISGKRILVRCDFNVPVDGKNNILEDFKIRQTLPTIKYLIERGAKVILMSHLDPESTGVADKKYSMDKVAKKLSELLDMPILKEDGCVGPEIESHSNALPQGQVMLLENLRFYKEETENNEEFAKKLSYIGDVYVNDSFGVNHRAHASLVGVSKFLQSCAGLLLEKEISILDKILKNPEKPMVAIIGGKKVETKSKLINVLSKNSDYVLVSGLIKKEAEEKNIRFDFPEKVLGPEENLDALDIDQKTIDLFVGKIMGAKTVLWNGPFGKFEERKYAKGTLSVAKAIIESEAFSVTGGGETVEFIKKEGMLEKFGWVSTGGGAMLHYLSGDPMPAIEALR